MEGLVVLKNAVCLGNSFTGLEHEAERERQGRGRGMRSKETETLLLHN